MQKIYKANPRFVSLLFKRNYSFPCDPIYNATNCTLKIINKLLYSTQTNLDLATCFNCRMFMTWKLDTQMLVTMRTGQRTYGYLMCSLLTKGENRGSLLICSIELKENSISNILETELSKSLYMVMNLCLYDLHTSIHITVIRITRVMP